MNGLYFIGNAHLDPVWLWRWQEGFFEITATFRSALDRMHDFPDFKFTSACSAYYEWIEKTDPAMFEEIRQRVQEGRWSIVGGWFLQPDCNLPDGESFARHALIAQRYFKDKFGITVNTGYNVDSFGHNASLPKILKKSGMDNYVFMRPMQHEKEMPDNVFRWESDDGSAVTAFRIHGEYCIKQPTMFFIDELQQMAETLGKPEMVFYGVGNHGGGPTVDLINLIKEKNYPGMRFATPDEYFADLDQTGLRVVREELQHHARGCYSACSWVKRQNRRCEQSLLAAEKFSLLAEELAGVPYPRERLTKAWRNLLFNQFHDILGGCAIKQAYDDAAHLYGEILAITGQIILFAAHQISRRIDTLHGETLPGYKTGNLTRWEHEVLGTPVVVFNPHTYPVTLPVKVFAKVSKMTDSDGCEIPFQAVRGDSINGEDRHQTLFAAHVPALGYAVYHFYTEKPAEKPQRSVLSATETVLENELIRAEFDGKTGELCRLTDKQTGRELLAKPCRTVLLDDSENDTWAHGKDSLGPVVGAFENARFTVTETGPVRATLRVTATCGQSVITRDYSVVPGSDELTVRARVDFREKLRVLKLAFPVAATDVTTKIPYGTVTRPWGSGEEPCGWWLTAGGVCIANDGQYAYDTEGDECRLTVLRSAIYADHFGQAYRDDDCDYMEQGEHTFVYSVSPFKNALAADRTAETLNGEVYAYADSFHDGSLPLIYSGFACEGDDVPVSAIKRHEDDGRCVLRLYDIAGNGVSATVRLFGKEIPVTLGHHAIAVVDDAGHELDMMEWEV